MKSVLKGLFFYEAETCGSPLVDLYETAEDLVFEVDLPGIDPANVSIKVYENLLIIEGERDVEEKSASGEIKYLCVERGMKDFRRVIKIPVHVNTIAGDAVYNNGVMTITFPKLKGKVIHIAIEKR
ncbi:MAG: Hsp20/alpha crystallin family protein [Nitrospirae bacterium]|nr:Hsp20/alpha crystallin family protein [Nitrospirota bacterium]MCL5978177.1 Hsp20/alpha crystallin family protein [Nitrospirota bacterium]